MREVPSPSSMAATFLIAHSLVACETVPYTGRSQLRLISPQEEGSDGGAGLSADPRQGQGRQPSLFPGGKVAVYTGILPVTKDETGAPRSATWWRGTGASA